MATSPHLQRQLQETLGSDAGDELVGQLKGMESIRAEVAALRHEMQLGFARADARAAATDALLTAMDVKFSGLMATGHARMEALLEKGLREQTRFFFLAWSVLLAAIIGLYAR